MISKLFYFAVFIALLHSSLANSNSANQGCSNDGDCQQSYLGELSRCNQRHECECYDTRSNGKQQVTLYNGRCVAIKKLGEFCATDDQCKAGSHRNARCDVHPSFLPQERICQCPDGNISNCDGSSGGGGGGSAAVHTHPQSFFTIAASTILMGIVAKVVG